MSIKQRLVSSKIQKLQIDPFGYCNAKCWFCPVKYIEQPEETRTHMSIDLIEKIFLDLIIERSRSDGLVHPGFNLFVTAHYNEILLYKDFEKLLELARKYRLSTFVMSNGVALSKQKIDIIKEYKDVIPHIGLNIPALEKELWAKRTGFTEDHFDRLMSNLEYAAQHLTHLGPDLQIHVNGVDKITLGLNDESEEEYIVNLTGSPLRKGEDFDESMDLDPNTGEHETQFQLARKLFPQFTINKSTLMDRAGFVSNAITNQPFLKETTFRKKVIGCTNWGDRITEWLHVNSLGDTFLCCNDFHFEHKYGNFKEQKLRDMWASDAHVTMVEKALGTICTKCTAAKFSDVV